MTRARPHGTRDREDWIHAALAALIKGGVTDIKIGKLARGLRVSRASFYWHFSSRAELLNELVKRWEGTNSRAFERVMEAPPSADAMADYQTIVDAWVHERDYSSAFDSAMREWARASKAVALAVRRVDDRRIASLHGLFGRLGFTDPEALVRARICYFHQVGYYALDFDEPSAQRLALEPFYTQVFTGRSAARVSASRVRKLK
jgi:AcrR family transcriptional regulator